MRLGLPGGSSCLRTISAAIALLFVACPALAQDRAADLTEPSAPGSAPTANPLSSTPPPSDEPPVSQVDASADRVILTSTAETHPEGTVYFTDYQLFILQGGYALTDDVQTTVTILPPLLGGRYAVDLSVKARLINTRRFRAAALVALDLLAIEELTTADWAIRATGSAQYCFNDACDIHATFNAAISLDSLTERRLPVQIGLGFAARLGSIISLLIEPIALFQFDRNGITPSSTFMFNYGLRFSQRDWGIDVSFIRPFGGVDLGGMLLGLPFVSVTYRIGNWGGYRSAPTVR